jgi:hypothetical protein
MNAQMKRERERDSENFDTRITANRVMVGKIWVFEVLGQNGHFRRSQGYICNN